MTTSRFGISRLWMSAAMVTAAAVGITAVAAGAGATGVHPAAAVSITPTSTANGYKFLDQMMDKYATGSTTRLVQSFIADSAMGSFTDSVTYDDALVVDALLARGTADDLARAQVIGNALLYVQANDAAKDGRIRAAYAPKPLTSPSKVDATDDTSDVGNMAWVGQALVQLYAKTGVKSYLTGATSVATWIQKNAYATSGPGGYTGGYDSSGKLTWKSTEHNIDLFAFFSMLATETGDSAWSTDAGHAQSFVTAMWDSAGKKFWVGTNPDGTSLNKGFLPEDVNTWSYLALKDPAYSASIDWDVANLAVTDGTFTGVSFAACDRSKVWFEGTAHLADALAVRDGAGDAAKAQGYLNSIQLAQTTAVHNDGLGIVAASHDKLSDCDSDYYYAAPHTGATSWYLLAGTAADPFLLLPGGSTGGGTATTYEAESTANALSGTASVIACGACSGGERVGHLGKQSSGTGTLTFNGVTATGGAGAYQVVVAFTDGSASRQAALSVDGGTPQTVTFGTTGSFTTPGNQTVTLQLAAGTNTISVSDPDAAAPDIDAITVPAAHS
ncbi:hypothetical protein ABH926_005899 [Catenulispora sp. GP43]|uniref:CBM35 domain-containing protein n=1 Tax=Catenulispora sp. GP43 TaxID=3156263 RepID=UPI003511B853